MKKVIKIITKILTGIICAFALFLIFITIYHNFMLAAEKDSIVPNGVLVSVDGFNMHIYAEGEKSDKPTLIIMSGSGVAAPVYDYKVLYSQLSDEYRVVVLEKFGYGYSDISGLPRDVETMISEDREALTLSGESGPFILLPHSMSALEALYWAKNYPYEISAIIGLDMAVPETYEPFTDDFSQVKFMRILTLMGMHRIPFYNPDSEQGLTDEEFIQHKYLAYKNTLNEDVMAEGQIVNDNAKEVEQLGIPDIPMLLFTSNGEDTNGDSWVKCQENFANRSDKIQLIELDCRHNIHHYESDYIAQKIKEFLSQ